MAEAGKQRKGIFLSLDVSIALLIIFTSVMLSFAYFSSLQQYGPSSLLTRAYLQDAAAVMSNRGDFSLPLVSRSRPDTTGISEVLSATPSSVCMQVEAYGVAVPDGLEAYWKLDEDTGATTVADSSGNGAVGAVNGTVFFNQPSRTGSAILFDGSTGFIGANVPALSGAYTFTEAAWVNFKSFPNAFPSIITRNGTLDGAIFLVQSGSKAGVQTGATWTAGSTELAPNTWYHIAATYDGTTVRLYVNGAQDGSYAYSSPLGSQDPVRVGALYTGSNAFNGTIDDVRIYSRALNATEISRIYSNPTNLLYTVSKSDCAYSGGDTQVLQVPFSANQDQNQNAYYYAVIKAWAKGARGGGTETATCGGAGQQCCSGSVCNSGYVCSANACVACGATSQPCCSGSTCGSYLTCSSGTCQCGGSGQVCCSGTTCNTGFGCNATTVTCAACGASGQICCAGSACNTNLTCSLSTCQACGGIGQACCAGSSCNTNFTCSAGTCQCGGSGLSCCSGTTCDTGYACNTTSVLCQSCGASAGQLCCSGNNCSASYTCNVTYSPQPICQACAPGWTQRTSSGSRAWSDVAISSDGTRIVAGANNASLYASNDSGVTWAALTGLGIVSSPHVTITDDGTKLAVTNSSGYIYTSTDSGATWTQRTGLGALTWNGIKYNRAGTKLFVLQNQFGYLQVSSNDGASWTQLTNYRLGDNLAISSDGTKLAASYQAAPYISTSNDSGVTWVNRTAAGSRWWTGIAISDDGTKLLSGYSNPSGYLYTSSDSGASWTQRSGPGSLNWYSYAMSGSGTKQYASYNGMYSSNDSGVTWVSMTGAPPGYILSTSDGSKLVAYTSGSGYIWTYNSCQ